ncbi:MAG: NAD(P)/FAD-dependent oxidoreductase [Desulfotomaculum sp.]|nr:NAD(P)/FAD-dependent oxidoreductase [Desulfotomaculum sp.]
MAEKNIVILGAGYGGLKAAQVLSKLLAEADDFIEDYQITLIDKNEYHTLMTQLYEPAAGTKDLYDVMMPINDILAGWNSVKFVKGTVRSIDLEKKIVFLDHGHKEVPFTYLINALGSEPEYFNIEGIKENSISLSSLNNAAKIWCRVERILEKLKNFSPEERKGRITTFVVGGGGLTGVEFTGELAYQLRQLKDHYQIKENEYKIILIEGSKNLLPGMASKVYNYAQKTLEDLGVEVITGELIKKADSETIYLSSGREINYNLFVWAGGIRGNRLAAKSGLKTDNRGRVLVNQHLQYVDDPQVYAIGDSALAKDTKTGRPVIATAQAAIQQGKLAAYNIYADIRGWDKKEYHPSLIFLLIHVGRHQAVGEAMNKLRRIKLTGSHAAWLKNIIPLKYRYMLGGFKMLFYKPVKNKTNNLKYELYNCNHYK